MYNLSSIVLIAVQVPSSQTRPIHVYPGRKAERGYSSTSNTDVTSYSSTSSFASIRQSTGARSQLLPPISSRPDIPYPSHAPVRDTSSIFSPPKSLIQRSPVSLYLTPSGTPVNTIQEILEFADQHTRNLNHPLSSFEPVRKKREPLSAEEQDSDFISPPMAFQQREQTHTSSYLYDRQDVKSTSLQASPPIDARKRSQYQATVLTASPGKQPARTTIVSTKAKAPQESRAVTFDIPSADTAGQGQVTVAFDPLGSHRAGHLLSEDNQRSPIATSEAAARQATLQQQHRERLGVSSTHPQNVRYQVIPNDNYHRQPIAEPKIAAKRGVRQQHQHAVGSEMTDSLQRPESVDADVYGGARGAAASDVYRRQFEKAEPYRREMLDMYRRKGAKQIKEPVPTRLLSPYDLNSRTQIFNTPMSSMASTLYSETLKANLQVYLQTHHL